MWLVIWYSLINPWFMTWAQGLPVATSNNFAFPSGSAECHRRILQRARRRWPMRSSPWWSWYLSWEPKGWTFAGMGHGWQFGGIETNTKKHTQKSSSVIVAEFPHEEILCIHWLSVHPRHSSFCRPRLVGGRALPLWKIWVRQLGLRTSQLNGKS